jgi:TetR/AcrR family transcriptional repressor of nem operon
MELRQRIILESLRLFSLKGFLSTSIQDILTAAGTSKGGFYNHFKSKEELFFAVLTEARKIWRDKHLIGLDQIDKSVGKVKKLLQNHRDYYLKDIECLPGGCIFVTLLVELDDQLPKLAQEVNRGFVSLKAMINRFLEQGKALGELQEDTDTNAVTEMIFSGILGATISYGMEKSPANADRTINAMIDYLNRLAPSR